MIGEFKTLMALHGPERQGDIKHSLASVEKAKEFLGYEPEIGVERGLEETVKWFVKNL